jgi:hypothetical protein
MKKVHLATSKDNLRPALNYFQVKNGFVYASDCHILVKLPVDEVFGKGKFSTTDEFYILGEDWKKQKMYAAINFGEFQNILTAYGKKGETLGMLKILTASEFKEKVGVFPDCEAIIPTEDKPTESIVSISFNPTLLDKLTEAMQDSCRLFNLTFFGQRKAIVVKHNKPEEYTNGLGLIMPVAF